MHNHYKFQTPQGLQVILIPKSGFVQTYCGIGCKYGGANVKYKQNGILKTSPYGIAHFIEHQLFAMPDGSDAFTTFNQQNASANAYTSSDKTMYYFTKNEEIESSLELLLQMYFTPYFTASNVEKEKSIIISELQMYQDNIGYTLTQKAMQHLYPEDDYSYTITGEIEDIKNTTVEDLLEAYHAFYSPKNSVLCLVGDFEVEEMKSKIHMILDKLDFSMFQPAEKVPTITSKEVKEPLTIYEKVSQEECMILIRMDEVTNKDAISCEKLLGTIDTILNLSSDFYQSLDKAKLFENDLDYQVVTYQESSYILITAPTKKGVELSKRIIDKLNRITKEDLSPKQLDLYLKHLKSKSILDQDLIETLGDNVLSYALEDLDYFTCIEDILKLNLQDMEDTLPYLRNALKTYIISKRVKK